MDDYITLGDLTWGEMPSGAISGSFIANSMEDGYFKYIVGEASAGGNGALGIRVHDDGKIWASPRNTLDNECLIDGGNVEVGVLYKFMMTWDSLTQSMDFYLNSNSLQKLYPVLPCTHGTSPNINLDLIGKGWDSKTWDGMIDDIALWDCKQTPESS